MKQLNNPGVSARAFVSVGEMMEGREGFPHTNDELLSLKPAVSSPRRSANFLSSVKAAVSNLLTAKVT
jgi:hypothetical protein